jgi:hypothetical protein
MIVQRRKQTGAKRMQLWDYQVTNPIGLAAGFDKDGEAIDGERAKKCCRAIIERLDRPFQPWLQLGRNRKCHSKTPSACIRSYPLFLPYELASQETRNHAFFIYLKIPLS